jgi:hypothetical protein
MPAQPDFPLQSRLLSHAAETISLVDSAAARVTEACEAHEEAWAGHGSPHRLAKGVLRIATSDPAAPVASVTEVPGKARCACVVELSADAASPGRERDAVWLASDKRIEIRGITTGALLEVVTDLKVNATPSALCSLPPSVTTQSFGSHGRRADEFPPALVGGHLVMVGFGDGTLRAVGPGVEGAPLEGGVLGGGQHTLRQKDVEWPHSERVSRAGPGGAKNVDARRYAATSRHPVQNQDCVAKILRDEYSAMAATLI